MYIMMLLHLSIFFLMVIQFVFECDAIFWENKCDYRVSMLVWVDCNVRMFDQILVDNIIVPSVSFAV